MGMFDRIRKGFRTRSGKARGDKGPLDIPGAPMVEDPGTILTKWRLEAISQGIQEGPAKAVHIETSGWPDPESREVAARLDSMGINIPWGYGQEFGEKDFKVIGLRAGGIGVVFFVESTRFGKKRLYAAKTLNSFLQPNYLNLPGWQQEKIALAFLEEALPWLEMGQHPHIVPVHLLKNIIHPQFKRNVPFVLSEFMPMGGLRGYLKGKGKLGLRESLALGIQLCDGLLHAYKHGLKAHLDLKPDNIMVYGDGVFKVTDFSANVIGTPGYMAPEQVIAWWRSQGKWVVPYEFPIDQRADQFAVGLILLEALRGSEALRLCREACMNLEGARKYIEKGLREITDDSLPENLKGILGHVFSPKPNDRFPDLSALKKEFLAAYEMEGRYNVPRVEIDDSADWWFDRGGAFYGIGRALSAEAPYIEALKRFSAIPGTEIDQANCLMNLGNIYRDTGQVSQAEPHYQEALNRFSAIPGREIDQASCLMNLGNVYWDTGQVSQAEPHYQEALKRFSAIPGTEISPARCLANLSILYFAVNNPPQARKFALEAIKLCESFSPEATAQIRAGCQEILLRI